MSTKVVTKPKPIGRPKMAKGEAKSSTVLVRMSTDDRKGVEMAAKAKHQTVSEWLRATLGGWIPEGIPSARESLVGMRVQDRVSRSP